MSTADSVLSRQSSVLAAEALLARATLWQWAARAFAYPEPALVAALWDAERRRELERAAAACCPRPTPNAQRPTPIPQQALAAPWTAVDQLESGGLSLPEEHTALFARRVPTPPHGTVYGAGLGFARIQDLARVGSFYKAFGFQVAAARPELPDYVCTELEFVAALLAKEAYARAQGWPGGAARVARGRRLFIREHLVPWFPTFADRLARIGRLGFYPAVAALVLALLACEGATSTSAAPGHPGSHQQDDDASILSPCS